MTHKRIKASAGLLLIGLLAGCGSSGGSGKSSSSSSSKTKSASSTSPTKSTKDAGKTYTSDSKGTPPAAGGNTPPPSQADTTDSLPSASSDAGSANAIKGQAVMNPGAPAAQQTPAKPH